MNTPRLPARVFYGVILCGVALGVALAAGGAWAHLEFAASRPEGRDVFDGIVTYLVLPVGVMVGATFGGLAGCAAAVVWDTRVSRDPGSAEGRGMTNAPPMPHQ